MSTIAANQSFVSGVPTGGSLTIPLTRITSQFPLSIGIPNPYYQLEAILVGEPIIESDKFIAEFTIDDNVNFILTLTGKRVDDGTKFQSGQFALNYKITEPRPRAHFIASTFMAICGLAGNIEVPDLINAKLNFDLPLLKISKLLGRRQTAYRLMIIEKATGEEFLLPPAISEEEARVIAFVYHAIVNRSFVWSSGIFETLIPATPEKLALMPLTNQPSRLVHDIDSFSQTVFGHSLSLGTAKIIMEDAIIQCPDEVRRELAYGDSHLVNIAIQSLSGQVKYEFPEAPSLPNAPWDLKLQILIDMESELDTAVVERYHALAASTLEGLTEEEKAAITARPELDEKAFLD